MAGGVEELLNMLYETIEDAHGALFGAEKCVLDRDKALDLLDEIRAQFPVELAEARKLVNARNEYIASAKREADLIRRQAEDEARRLVSESEVLLTARQKGQEMVATAEERARELRRVSSEYAEDALKRTEEAIAEALDEVKKSRVRFRTVTAGQPAAGKGNPVT